MLSFLFPVHWSEYQIILRHILICININASTHNDCITFPPIHLSKLGGCHIEMANVHYHNIDKRNPMY